MRALFIAMLGAGLCLAGCGPAADGSSALTSPAAPTTVVQSDSQAAAGPTAVVKSDSQAAAAPAGKTVEVPFHSELTVKKV